MDTFQQIRKLVRSSQPPEAPEAFRHDALARRLLHALQDRRAGPGDLAGLVRQVLLREEHVQAGAPQFLVVPAWGPWPGVDEWDNYDLRAVGAGSRELRVETRRWCPSWLFGADRVLPAAAATAEAPRRTFDPVPGDPFLREMDLATYRCAAQREMVRAVLAASPGTTLVLNLPTGAGKSLCGQLPALLWSHRPPHGTSVVVVPTTALAIDQERALEACIDHPVAYFSGSGQSAARRSEMLRRIEDGNQRIVYCSPESVVGSLFSALRKAASRGLLRLFVVDEAHVIDQWGAEFRPEFQVLAGVRRELLRSCSGERFRTVLMTATLTDPCLDTLEVLFGRDGAFEVISAVQLRPEPEYWSARCEDDDTKICRVLDAIRHLPRPLILYTTQVAHAHAWQARLEAAGFRRCATVSGRTPADSRSHIIREWRDGAIDLICATSAFGLGMDKSDVRAVVHACVPESLDRYYQEVGRGGRDGRACVSLTIYSDGDVSAAEGMSQEVIIGVEKGLRRWRRMFEESTSLGGGRFRVPLDVVPGFDVDHLDMVSDTNRGWNVRTLTLMARAGLLELDAEDPISEPAFGEEVGSTRVVAVLDEDHRQEEKWQCRVRACRQRSYATGAESVRQLMTVLTAQRCAADAFGDAYTLEGRNPPIPRARVARCCSSCPYCRANGRPMRREPLPIPPPRAVEIAIPSSELERLLEPGDVAVIYYERWERTAIERLLWWLASIGIRHFVVPEAQAELLRPFERVFDTSREVIFRSCKFSRRRAPRVPALVFHPTGATVSRSLLPQGGDDPFPRVLLLHRDAADPVVPTRRLRDVIECRAYSLEEVLLLYSL